MINLWWLCDAESKVLICYGLIKLIWLITWRSFGATQKHEDFIWKFSASSLALKIDQKIAAFYSEALQKYLHQDQTQLSSSLTLLTELLAKQETQLNFFSLSTPIDQLTKRCWSHIKFDASLSLRRTLVSSKNSSRWWCWLLTGFLFTSTSNAKRYTTSDASKSDHQKKEITTFHRTWVSSRDWIWFSSHPRR